jgi:hypothetical protein
MDNAMKTNLPPFISRLSFLLALVGAFIGVVIGLSNGDEIGWAFLRGACLFLAFGIMTRWWLGSVAKAWLESRLESLQSTAKNTKTNEPRPALGR